jgi:hypothetical protein
MRDNVRILIVMRKLTRSIYYIYKNRTHGVNFGPQMELLHCGKEYIYAHPQFVGSPVRLIGLGDWTHLSRLMV